MSLGWTLNLFLLDECTRHDSSCVIECIARTLEDVKRISETTGRCMPSTVFVCSDNTPREAKKQYMLSYLVALTSKNLCRCTGLLNLRKSHSHDQVDQLWGILARRISSCDSLKSPHRWFPLWSQSWQGQDSNLGLGCKQLQAYVKSIQSEIGKAILHHNKSASAVAWKKTQRQTIVFWWCSVEARWRKNTMFTKYVFMIT